MLCVFSSSVSLIVYLTGDLVSHLNINGLIGAICGREGSQTWTIGWYDSNAR